ncbi:MAG: class I SAM-dependent methyltransferase, partial [Bacteroidota bacterium]
MKTQPKQTTSSKGSGSYLLEDFSGHEVELKRLQRQANLLPDIEKNALIRQGLKPDHDVLDLACGPGLTSCMIDSCLTTGSVIGVDYDANMIRAAKAISLERGHDIHFSQGDVYQLPEEMNESFDFVYCRFLFQHLQNPEKALQSI